MPENEDPKIDDPLRKRSQFSGSSFSIGHRRGSHRFILVPWRFCDPKKTYLTIYSLWFWDASPTEWWESSIEYVLGMPKESLLSLLRYCFPQALYQGQENIINKVSYFLIFVIQENEIFISVIVYFFCSWTVLETLQAWSDSLIHVRRVFFLYTVRISYLLLYIFC